MRKYRRIVRNKNSRLQNYQISLIVLIVTVTSSSINFTLLMSNIYISLLFKMPFTVSLILMFLAFIIFALNFRYREQVSTLSVDYMNKEATKLSKRILRLFNDKQITDVLRLSNSTRFGDEMPEIYVFVDKTLSEGYIAIENIANWERADREKFEQRVSGVLSGKYQKFAVVSSELAAGDSFIKFYFEDTLTSQRLLLKDDKDSLQLFVSNDSHAIRLSKDLVWHADITAHLSIIARTRAGKSIFAGRYLAQLMLLQGWTVEYNSAKYDRYVKEFEGQSEPRDSSAGVR